MVADVIGVNILGLHPNKEQQVGCRSDDSLYPYGHLLATLITTRLNSPPIPDAPIATSDHSQQSQQEGEKAGLGAEEKPSHIRRVFENAYTIQYFDIHSRQWKHVNK